MATRFSAAPTPTPATAPTAAGAGQVAAVWRDRLSLLLESTGEGIFGIDMAGCCVFVNRSAAQMLGWPADAIIGRNMHELIHHTHADGRHYPECDCPIFKAFRQGLPCRIDDEVFWRADGSAFDAEYTSHPIVEHGTVQGAVVTLVDITQRREAQALLRRTNELLESRVAERTAELQASAARLRELANHGETVREQERTRIAREIHDELGSLLVALKMDVHWLAKRLDDRPQLHGKCQGMGRLIDSAVDNLGRIITDLRPSILDHQGLWAALEWQAQEFFAHTADGHADLQADLQITVAAGVPPPEGGQAIAIFRIFQEMLSNVARHARARNVQVRLWVDDPPEPVLYLSVRDDGVGAPAQALEDARSYGVMGMRERASHFGGKLHIDSAPGQGTRVRLVMPLVVPLVVPMVVPLDMTPAPAQALPTTTTAGQPP
ncbi:MAG: PAS domain-containing protein [Aquabacterium sp.]|nr:PAS domain-containing protein [Aquabacterium sp.]